MFETRGDLKFYQHKTTDTKVMGGIINNNNRSIYFIPGGDLRHNWIIDNSDDIYEIKDQRIEFKFDFSRHLGNGMVLFEDNMIIDFEDKKIIDRTPTLFKIETNENIVIKREDNTTYRIVDRVSKVSIVINDVWNYNYLSDDDTSSFEIEDDLDIFILPYQLVDGKVHSINYIIDPNKGIILNNMENRIKFIINT